MKRLSVLFLIVTSLFLTSCAKTKGDSSESTSSRNITTSRMSISLFIYESDGDIEKPQAFMSLGGNDLEFIPSSYGLDKMVIGDYFTLFVDGTITILEAWPSILKIDGKIINVTQEKSHISKFIIKETESGEKYVSSVDKKLFPEEKYNSRAFITDDSHTMDVKYSYINELDVGTEVYGAYSKNITNDTIYLGMDFYTFNPRP